MTDMQSQTAAVQQSVSQQPSVSPLQPDAKATMGTLSINTDPSPLAISVLDRELKTVARVVSPAQVRLPPGLYVACASRVGHPDLSQFAWVLPNSDRSVRLSDNAPGILTNAATTVTDLLDKYVRRIPTFSPIPTIEPVSGKSKNRLQFWVRFTRLTDWNSAETVTLPAFSTSDDNDKTLLELTNTHQHAIFAQVSRPDARPVNVAIPPAGSVRPARCYLVVASEEGLLQAHVRLSTDWANAALQYMALGRYAEASQLVETANQHKSRAAKFVQQIADRTTDSAQPGWFGQFVQRLIDRFDDPAAALVPRYVGLRTRDLNVFNTLGDFVLDVIQGLSDGLIISAEIAARKNQHRLAASDILALPAGGLPLFSDGFSLLAHRVKELIDVHPEGLPPEQVPTPEQVERIRSLRSTLLKWAPFVNINSPTLTFRGNDITAPKEEESPIIPNPLDGWIAGPPPPSSS
jgi:hypothetical protein